MRLVLLYLTLISLPFALSAQTVEKPFKVLPLFDQNKPETVGLSYPGNSQHFTIFKPDSTQNTYNHGVVLYPFRGKLFAMWQSSKRDEDAPDTRIMYSTSVDGEKWSEPIPLTNPQDSVVTTSGGWWSYNDTLIAYINVWPNRQNDPRQGYTTYKISTDGIRWSDPEMVLTQNQTPLRGIIEQDVKALPGGRIITAFHMQPGLIATPYFTDDPAGISGWTKGEIKNLPSDKNISRELEPSWFYQKNGAIVMIFRDQKGSHKKLASISKDNGETWSKPTLINTPDSRSKQSAGNLPDGTAYMVNNPTENKTRFPLAIILSEDGYIFDKAFLLRSGAEEDLQPLKYPGKYKRPGYSYPKSVLWGDYLYISYATNKEDVELTRVPVSSLQ